ncbi:hypothetical protein D3C81_2109750 [compost metagenome]
MTLDVECRKVARFTLDEQAMGLEAVAFIFPQVYQSRLGLAYLHGFRQDSKQQRLEAGFRR